jgi:hypothetical protein
MFVDIGMGGSMNSYSIESLLNLFFAAASGAASTYQCVLARSARPQTKVTKQEAHRALFGAYWEISALDLSLSGLRDLAKRNALLDWGLHPGPYRPSLSERADEWRRYCLYHDDLQRHVYRLDNEREVAQRYYDVSSADDSDALSELLGIDTTLKQLVNKSLSMSLEDAAKLTAGSLELAKEQIAKEFQGKFGYRSTRLEGRTGPDTRGGRRPDRDIVKGAARGHRDPGESGRGRSRESRGR